MPFPEPETSLASTIGAAAGEIRRPRQRSASWSLQSASDDFSTTYTKAQQLSPASTVPLGNALFKTVILSEADYFG
jgi:hypothetical protein